MPKLYCIVTLLFVCLATTAQEPDRFVNYTVNEGLPQSTIYDITQDKDGFIWIGTAGGLCRFDGYQFRTYRMSIHDPKAISSYKEFRFYNDSSGRLWIIHFNGISIYNALTDNFTNILTYTPRNVVIAENHFYGEDKDHIWIGLCSYGIVKVDKRTLQVYTTPLTKTSLRPSNNVGYHGFLEHHKLWIVDNNESDKHIFLTYDIEKQKTDTLPLELTDIINLNDSDILAMDTRSVFLINKRTLAVHASVPVLPDRIHHNSINIYRKSAAEAILSSALHGLFYVHTNPLRISRHISVSNPDSKQPLYARCVFEDRSGNLWVGSRGSGVEKKAYPYKKFQSYRSGATQNNVFGVFADKDNLYVGMQAQGLTVFSRDGQKSKNITINRGFPQALNNAYTIAEYGKDKLIIIATSSENNGHNVPFLYTKATGKIELLNKEVQELFRKHWGRGNLRNFLYREASGKYLTNVGEYLVALQPRDERSFSPELIHHFAGENIASGFTDSRNIRWVGTFTGVFKENATGWQRVHLPRNKEVKSISEDAEGNMWFGTNDEIFVVDRSLKTIHHYMEDRELVNGHVYAIRRDKYGNMWLSHNKGLSVYRRHLKRFEHFDQADGLQSAEFNVGASFMSEDGEMFFGGINGITAFYPNEISSNPYTPAARITGIRIFDEPLRSDTAYWNIREINLPYTENSISFEFTLPEYTQQAKNRYQFRMSSIDDRWINAGDRRFTRYAGLRPGKYMFEVRGANSDGVWGPSSAIAITIRPPFWQQTWFIILIIAIFIFISVGIGIFIQKIRQRKAIRALELQHKIQLERERISRDLHDNVGTQLSLISKNLEGVIDPHTPVTDTDRMHHLQNISQTSKEVIFTLRETIWALNREEISLEELFDKLKSFAQKLSGINNKCQLVFNEEPGNDKVVLSPSEAIHLFRICQEAIANSMKYANASELSIHIGASGSKYRIVIADNGVGFDPAARKAGAHYGLDNMQYRSEEIQCSFSIESGPGAGTRILIQKT